MQTSENLLNQKLQYLNGIAEKLMLHPDVLEFLKKPMNTIEVNFPAKMDDGSVEFFQGYRIQHNNARGPFMGGFRFHSDETIDTCQAHALETTLRNAVFNLPLGGAMGAVSCDLRGYSLYERERIVRSYARRINKFIGEYIDFIIPDLYANAQVINWLVDEISILRNYNSLGIAVGKSQQFGGSLGQKQASGYGLVQAIGSILESRGIDSHNASIAIQGFGNIAQYLASALPVLVGCKIDSISIQHPNNRQTYTISHPKGIEFKKIKAIFQDNEINLELVRDEGYVLGDGDEWLKRKVDMLIPTTNEGQINDSNVSLIDSEVKIVLEISRDFITPGAEAFFDEQGIFLIPDILSIGGEHILYYLEQVQNKSNLYMNLDDILSRIGETMTEVCVSVHQMAIDQHVDYRTAAYMIGMGRIADTIIARGWV